MNGLRSEHLVVTPFGRKSEIPLNALPALLEKFDVHGSQLENIIMGLMGGWA